jgi:hypothetical protein
MMGSTGSGSMTGMGSTADSLGAPPTIVPPTTKKRPAKKGAKKAKGKTKKVAAKAKKTASKPKTKVAGKAKSGKGMSPKIAGKK